MSPYIAMTVCRLNNLIWQQYGKSCESTLIVDFRLHTRGTG